MKGSLVIELPPIHVHPAGRVCAHKGCRTRLSVYNPSAHCGAHQPDPPMVYLGVAFTVCECGSVVRSSGNASGLCASCAAKARARRTPMPRSLRKDGRLDAIQLAQARARARAVS